ncbi:hypothetical protein NC651_004520 [Populus alba x Populus x berolinensis]|nr:hypothetical protein NC651_004520 [Populus alba x Populus x berolinensis]
MNLVQGFAGLVIQWGTQLPLVKMALLSVSPAPQIAIRILHLLRLCLQLSINISLGPALLVYPWSLRTSLLHLLLLGDSLPQGVKGIRSSQLMPCLLLYFLARLPMVFQL